MFFKNYTRKNLELSSLTALTILLGPCAAFSMDPPQFSLNASSQGAFLTLESIRYWIHKAKVGDREAQDKCIDAYYNGMYPNLLTPEALDFFSWNNIEERCYIDDIYANFAFRFPETRNKFSKLTQNIIERADRQSKAVAQNTLGIMYAEGLGVEKSKSLAVKYYQLAANQGFAPAQNNLGSKYRTGTGVEKNEALAFQYAQLAAEQGFAIAQKDLANLYKNATSNENNIALAFKYYQLAADQGQCYAQYELGSFFLKGTTFLESDPKKAVYYFQLAADQALPAAQWALADCYKSGTGIEKNAEFAFRYFKLAADQGDVVAQYSLGCTYLNGNIYIKKDHKKALLYFRLVADQGFIHAQKAVALMYGKGGDEFSKNDELCFKYFKAAADQGDPEAKFSLGNLYNTGTSYLKKDDVKSLEYLQAAADLEHPIAQEILGFNYLKGGNLGLQQDDGKAIHYLELAANQGQHFAQKKLAYLYANFFESPLTAIKFAYKALTNPNSLEDDKNYLLQTLIPLFVSFEEVSYRNQASHKIEEINKANFFVKHDFSTKLEYLARNIPLQCKKYELQYQEDKSLNLFYRFIAHYIEDFAADVNNFTEIIFMPKEEEGFCITAIQPLEHIQDKIDWLNLEARRKNTKGQSDTEQETFSFFDLNGITYSSIGGKNPKLGFRLKEYVRFKKRALQALEQLKTVIMIKFSKLAETNESHNAINKLELKEQIDFLYSSIKFINSACDPLETELVRTLPLRNRAFKVKNKEIFGDEQRELP